jgi:2-methylcitrate dehydratase PrpD
MAKHLLCGNKSSEGILATLLAKEGMIANPRALEDHFGFFENFCRGETSVLEHEIESLGETLDILESGITHKIYPSCGASHTAIDSALEIVRSHPLNPDDVEEIEAVASPFVEVALMHHRPRTVVEARFSLEYCVSRAILDGQMGPDQFTTEKVQDSAVQTLIDKVRPVYREGLVKKKGSEQVPMAAELLVRLKDGTVYSSHVDHARGTPENPVIMSELEQKFQQCCKGRLSEQQISQAIEELRHFEESQDVADFVSLISGT